MWQRKNSKQHKLRYTRNNRYSSLNYANPYFRRPASKNYFRWPAISFSGRFKLIIILLLLLIIAITAIVFFSGWLTVKDIRINGADRIDEKLIRQITENHLDSHRWLFLKNSNLVFLNLEQLAEKLENRYSFEYLSVKKKWPNSIIISYQEKNYALIWQEDDVYSYVDSSGSTLAEANLLEIGEKDYPILVNETGIKTLGTKIAADNFYISRLLEFFRLSKEITDIKAERFIKDEEEGSLKVKLADGPMLYLNVNDNIQDQLNRIIIIKQEKLKDDFFRQEYIDLRYGNSIYYR